MEINNLVQNNIFDFENQKVRVFNINEEIYFVATDISSILGYSQSSGAKAVRNFCKHPITVHELMVVLSGQPNEINKLQSIDPQTKLISEHDVYRFIMKSQQPNAEPFQDWVSSVVVTIRKTGGYNLHQDNNMTNELLKSNTLLIQQIMNLTNEITQIKKQLLLQNIPNKEFNINQLVEYLNNFVPPNGAPTNINKILDYLRSIKMLKSNNVPYAKYLEYHMTYDNNPYRDTKYNLIFKKFGVEYIIEHLRKNSYL